MKKALSKALAIILALVMIVSSVPAFASFQTASLLTSSADGSNWMGYINGATKLTEITIPGSHDSGAKNAGIASTWAQTQSLNISSQLNAGVRFLDMRLEYDGAVDGNIKVVHSSIDLMADDGGYLTLKACINDVYNFLNNHPTETVIMCMKEDDGSNESKIVSQINSFIYANPNKWYVSSGTPSLDQARGKIILATRMSTLSGIYFNWGDQGSDGGYVYDSYKRLYIQDRYNMGTSNKWNNAVQPLLDFYKPDGYWSINFLSTTGGNINGVSSNANVMNQLFNDYTARNNKCYGIIMFDYVSDGLCRKAYKCNDLVAKNQPDPSQGQYYYRLNWNTTQEVGSGWTGVYCKLHYRTNNGIGSEKTVTIFEAGDQYNGYQYVCNAENWDFSGYVPGFPTYVEFFYDFGHGAKTLKVNQRLYVGKSPSSLLSQVASNDFVNSSYIGKPCKGTEQYYAKPLPKASTIEFRDSSDVYVDVPMLGSGQQKTVTFSSVVRDQYGVDWYDNSTSYSLDGSYAGIRLYGNTLYIDEGACEYEDGKSIYVTVKHSTTAGVIESKVKKRIILNVVKAYYKYINYDGTILQQGALVNGSAPVYIASTPKKESNETHHYIFNGFVEASNSSASNRIYVASFDEAEHIASNTRVLVEATCAQNGHIAKTCDCGYAWTEIVDALPHDMITEDVESTCAHQGYHRVHCKNCDYIESETLYTPVEHDIKNAYAGAHISQTEDCNGYIPYYCPICDLEIVELRQYDDNDWSAYYDAVKKYNNIKNSAEYNSYFATMRYLLESQINGYISTVESKDNVMQKDIDDACSGILTTIEDFSSAVGVSFYTISFIFADGRIEKTTYLAGTNPEDVKAPQNSETTFDEESHYIYVWPEINTVTKNVSYFEITTFKEHTLNSSTIEATCTKGAKQTLQCECGYSFTEYTSDALGHVCDSFVGYDKNNLTYHCSRCNENYNMSNKDVLALWGIEYINKRPSEVENGNLLNVVRDNVINAKDYAALLQHSKLIYKNDTDMISGATPLA